MKEFWNMVQLVFAAVGGWLGYFLGGCDGLLIALVVFVVVDYVTGVMCAVSDKELSSKVGFRGICRKVLIFFYLSNEGVSLLENAAHLGLPIPKKLKDVLAQIHNRAENGGDGE